MIKTIGFYFNGKVYANKGLHSAAQKKAMAQIVADFQPQDGQTNDQAAYEHSAEFVFQQELKTGYKSLGKWVFVAITRCYLIAASKVTENKILEAAQKAIRDKELAAAKELQAKKLAQWEKERKQSLLAAKKVAGSWKK